jgi:hypothetical protein
MKYYYDNLVDALQAIKHGIEIKIHYSLGDYTSLKSLNFEDVSLGDAINIGEYYVAKESKYLLQPQKNDTGISWGELLKFDGNIWQNSDGNITNTTTTSFRNGIYFP